MNINKKRQKKSVRLSEDEHKNLKEYYQSFHTDSDFADEMKMDRVTLNRIMVYGSGKQENIIKIQKKLKRVLANA